ncbi:hypothetical protein BCR33DRAFT_713361 [Rhizoclosmatium globosum]|uniref:Uncharacterized protein n=1 Tax=Rhizoclosmatium globosum TaxID=329046 RepID=A0A1Y2CUF6_9FUNG|nr:hypothetical protein BCR33DRAFT_713361 [Rhizoclosmatium globosum]|eukprot:ORY50597.1 hypothetical protein BCR33DRAFT_713361 [Rhizoclosmatium globosum]
MDNSLVQSELEHVAEFQHQSPNQPSKKLLRMKLLNVSALSATGGNKLVVDVFSLLPPH